MLSRIYLEITNICNRSCVFCPGTKRAPRSMTPEEFSFLAERLRPHTQYLYLHVMGEPLTHPQLPRLLEIADGFGFRVIITTNGTLLPMRGQTLLEAACVHKVHISLHSFEADAHGDFEAYVRGCTAFGLAAREKNILVNYRLWNMDGAQTTGLRTRNAQLMELLHEAFAQPWTENSRGYRLDRGVFVEYGERFLWPELGARDCGQEGFCHALRDQAAVLCDGTVVPCCLDHEGDIALGNLFREEFSEILQGPAAQQLYEGFSARKRMHPLCRTCGYAERFSRKV